MSDAQIVLWNTLSRQQQQQALQRPVLQQSRQISQTVSDIIRMVQQQGDKALFTLNARYDRQAVSELSISVQDIDSACLRIAPELSQAIQIAAQNIEHFHQAQQFTEIDIETQPGVRCQLLSRSINSVGLYIPGGSAPLFSTVLMLAIPARLAGCQRIVMCSPPPLADEILFAARLCGVTEIYQVGGAQAIAAMSFGTETLTRVDKIFGPGNAYVTEAKSQISQHQQAAAIDMPAGPSELLVIADSGANADFIAADLLSQAEHGPDSQVILLSPDRPLVQQVAQALTLQAKGLPRADIAGKALKASRLIVTADLEQCCAISNQYAPEHLLIQTRQPRQLLDSITNAGSVFLGDWSPESAGDYASGTNHVLPTYGYTATYSSLGLADFQKRMTVQEISPAGLINLAAAIETMATAEQLQAHKMAVTVRIDSLRNR